MQPIVHILILAAIVSCPAVCGLAGEDLVPESRPSEQNAVREYPPQPPDPDSFPEIVARVNESSIRKQSFLARAASVQSDMGLPEGDLPLQIYRTILNEMVDMELLFQASQDRNFGPDPDEVETQYQALVARFPSEEAFLSQLSSQATTSQQFKELMYRDMSVQRLVKGELEPRVSIDEQAKLGFYDENRSKMEQPEQLRLGHILIRLEPGASSQERESAHVKIGELLVRVLQEGNDFAELARQFSEDSGTREEGGEMLIKRGQTVPAFEQAAFDLEPGGVSEIVETQFGFHIIKLYEKVPGRVASYEEVESMIQELLEQRQLQEVIKAEIEGLRQEASVEVFI